MRSGHRLIGTLSILAVAAGTLSFSLPAEAQLRRTNRSTAHVPGSMGIPQPEPRITLSIQNRSLGRVLSEIFKQTPYKYENKAGLGNQLYSLEAKNLSLTVALRTLLAQDKEKEPLVFAFHMSPAGQGTFTFHREYAEVGVVEGENRVSLANARVTTVLPLVFKQMNAKYRIEPDVPPVLVSLQLRPQKWDPVLAQVILEAYKQEPTLTYSLDGDTYVVHLHKNPTTVASYLPDPAKPARKVKLVLASAPLSDALNQLFQGSEWKYEVADKVNKEVTVTYSTAAEPEFGALSAILKQASGTGNQITYREGKGIIYIEPGPLPGLASAGAKGGINQEATTSLSVTQKSLRMIVKQLETPLKVKIEVAPNIPDVPVSFTVVNGTADEFLKAILQSARASVPTLIFKMKEEGVYRLELGAAM